MITDIEFRALAAQGYNRIPLVLETFADLDTPLSLYLKLAAARYTFLLESVVGGDDAVAKKPDAAPLLLAAARLGVAPARMLMVGDSVNDVAAARAAGSPVLVVPYGYNEGSPVQTLAADGIVDSLDAIADRIRRG